MVNLIEMEGGFSRVVVPDKHGLAAMEKEPNRGLVKDHWRKRSLMLWLLDCWSDGVLVAGGG